MKKLLIIPVLLSFVGTGCTNPTEPDVVFFEHEDGTQISVERFTDDTAEVVVTMFISDEEEYIDLLGEQVPMVPTFINLSCQLYQSYLFDRKGYNAFLASTESEVNFDAMKALNTAISGYDVQDFHIMFEDSEDGELIAECIGSSPEFDDLIFSDYRTYPESEFTDVKIGDKLY